MASRRFDTTRWSLVLAARAGSNTEARDALAALCEAYWYPLYAFVRRQGYGPDEAQDLTQGYFLRLLEKDWLDDVNPAAGRFRSFLLASLRHHLAHERERASALKRGGAEAASRLDLDGAESRYAREPSDHLTAEALFERRWAQTVLDRVKSTVRREQDEAGKARQFELLRGRLTGETVARPYGEVAAELDMSEGAVKVAVHRLRKRFGQLLREEIAQTVAAPADVDAEIRHLLEIVASDRR